jgi:hypothetical protein
VAGAYSRGVDFLELPGVIGGICLVGFVLWSLGVRDPFILAAVSIIGGGAFGALVEWQIGKLIDSRRKRL